jgi:hypothetical protein
MKTRLFRWTRRLLRALAFLGAETDTYAPFGAAEPEERE